MRCSVLMGSPHKRGNTASLTVPFIEALEKSGTSVDYIWLYDKAINPCVDCKTCQNVFDTFGCPIEDDMKEIFDSLTQTDCIILATPIYAWYCTAPMKALLDRLVYGINKYYGDEPGPSLWRGKKVAVISSCGYKPEHGSDLFEEGIKRICKHSKLEYMGMLTIRDLGDNTASLDREKKQLASDFAKQILASFR